MKNRRKGNLEMPLNKRKETLNTIEDKLQVFRVLENTSGIN